MCDILKMEHFFVVCFGLLCVFTSAVKGCPNNCFCDELQTSCVVNSCDDSLPIEYTDFLKITGEVCKKQRDFLRNLSPNTIVIMVTDTCIGIQNCRDNRRIKNYDEITIGIFDEGERKEIVPPTEGVPFLPVQTENDEDNGGNNDDNNGANNDDNNGANNDEVMTEEPSIETTVEMTTEMTTETSTEQETTAETMVIVPYRTRDRDEDGNTSTSVTVYRR